MDPKNTPQTTMHNVVQEKVKILSWTQENTNTKSCRRASKEGRMLKTTGIFPGRKERINQSVNQWPEKELKDLIWKWRGGGYMV